MVDYTRVRQDFVLYMTMALESEYFGWYSDDLIKLLILLRKASKENEHESWTRVHDDRLASFCDYLLAKMSMDSRFVISKERPFWLCALSGRYDICDKLSRPEIRLNVFRQIEPEVESLLRVYGPDGRDTLPPPPGAEDDSSGGLIQ